MKVSHRAVSVENSAGDAMLTCAAPIVELGPASMCRASELTYLQKAV